MRTTERVKKNKLMRIRGRGTMRPAQMEVMEATPLKRCTVRRDLKRLERRRMIKHNRMKMMVGTIGTRTMTKQVKREGVIGNGI